MFRSQEMCKVELIVPERNVVPVTEVLAASGVFHHTPSDRPRGESSQRSSATDWPARALRFAQLEQRVLNVMEALDVDQGAPPEETPHPIEPEIVEMDIERLENESLSFVRDLEREQQKLEELNRYVSQLRLISELTVDLEAIRHLRYTYLLMGRLPTVNLERLESSLERIPSTIVTLQEAHNMATVLLIGARRDGEILDRAARSAYLNPLKLPETYRGTPKEAIAALEASIRRSEKRIDEARAGLEKLHERHIQHLRLLLWRVRASRQLAATIAQYGTLRYTYVISGWVPSSQVETLMNSVQGVSKKALCEVDRYSLGEGGDIPVIFQNPPLVKAFQTLVTNYGYPRYGELDPTPLLALTFPIVFGLMFGDVGHGLLLALVGLLLASQILQPLKRLTSLGVIVAICGVSSMIFGFLYGSLLGFEDVLVSRWVNPLENTIGILSYAILIGAAILTIGMVSNVINALLLRHWGPMLFGHNGLAGILFYWSLLGLLVLGYQGDFFVSTGTLLTLAGLASGMMIFSHPLSRLIEGERPVIAPDFTKHLIQAPFELFEVTIALTSNTLSYVRVGAFAVAHGALNMVVMILAAMAGPRGSLGYWIVIGVGSLFIVGFEGLIVGIQTLRLEYYEFFSKFFAGNGVQYQPLSLISARNREG